LWHLADAGWRGPTVVIGLNYPGEPGLAELGEAIAAAARRAGRRVAVVASGDMSHRLQPGAPAGFHPRAKEFDSAFIACLRAGNYRKLPDFDPELKDLAAEDAVDSTLVAASAVNWNAAGHEVLSYEGPFGVGYGIAILHQFPSENASDGVHETGRRENDVTETGMMLPQIARRSIEAAFRGDAEEPDIAAAGILGERHGVFVTIRGPRRKLRGCVGTLTPRFGNTAGETWHVARDAAFRDGRFAPVIARELDQLRFEVSVVLPPEEVASSAELDPRCYGIVVATADGRRGVLLPDVEGVETVGQQLAIARSKGDIGESEPVRIQRFAVMKFREEDWRTPA
jgi:AMMECR1 domain-containing protein